MGVIRVLPLEEIEQLLRTALIARIACCDHSDDHGGRPYLVPIAYGYDGESIFLHSGPGRKIDIMRKQPLVTVEVDEGIAPDRWRSVVVEGEFHELSTTSEIQHALVSMYGSISDVPSLDTETIVVKITITHKSGRYELPE